MILSNPRFLVLAALMALPHGAATAATQAGVTAAVQGNVDFLSVLDDKRHKAAGGEEIYLGDEISSAANSGMQLMLLDETVFTIGPDTDLSIDDFVYDPATGAGQMSASLTKGLFRFVAGNIAQGDPEDMQINLPTGTIGIRGTSGIIQILPPVAGGPAGGSVLVVLLETSGGNGFTSGMLVTSGGESVELVVPGFGTVLVSGEPPAPPFLVEDSFFTSAAAFFSPGGSDEDDGPPDGEPGDPIDGDGQPGEGGPDGPDFADGEFDDDAGFEGEDGPDGGPDGGPGDGPDDGGLFEGEFDGEFGEGGFLADGFGDDFFGEGGFGGEFFEFDGEGGGDFFGDFNLAGDFGDFSDFTQDCEEIGGEVFCDGVQIDGSGGGPSTISNFADVFTLLGSATYNLFGVFFQTSPVTLQGIVSATFNINFDNKTFCETSCSVSIDTLTFDLSGFSDDFTISSFDYQNETGSVGELVTGVGSFTGTKIGLVDSDGIIANKVTLEVFYSNGSIVGSTNGVIESAPR